MTLSTGRTWSGLVRDQERFPPIVGKRRLDAMGCQSSPFVLSEVGACELRHLDRLSAPSVPSLGRTRVLNVLISRAKTKKKAGFLAKF